MTSFSYKISLSKLCYCTFQTKKSSLDMFKRPTTLSQSITSIKMLSVEVGQAKLRCSFFQLGWQSLVSRFFFVSSIYSPMVTLTEQFISPKVRQLRLNSTVQNLKLMISTFSSLNVAERVIKPAGFLSQFRKHLNDIVCGFFCMICPGANSGLFICKALRYGSRSMMPNPIKLSDVLLLLSMSSTSRHLPKYLQQLFTVNLKKSLNLGFFPPFFTTVPLCF